MAEKRELRSQSLDLLRFPLAVVVVVVHVFTTDGLSIQGHFVSTVEYPCFVAINHFIDAFLRSQSVPIYYFISGYVFFVGVELTREKYLQKLRNRVKTLLIPYVAWNLIAMILIFLKMLPIFHQFSSYTTTTAFSFSELIHSAHVSAGTFYLIDQTNGEMISLGSPLNPIDGPLWFLSYLMIVVLLAPAIYWLLRRVRIFPVVLFGVVWFALGCLDFDYLYLFFTALFFFSFGAYMSINRKDMLREFGRWFRWSMVMYPLLAIIHISSVTYFPEWACAIKHLTIFVGLFFAYNLATWLLEKGICKVHPSLASAGFFIYVAHMLVCLRIIKILYLSMSPSSDFAYIVLYVLSAVLTILLLLLTHYLLQRYCPSLLRVLTGRKA